MINLSKFRRRYTQFERGVIHLIQARGKEFDKPDNPLSIQ